MSFTPQKRIEIIPSGILGMIYSIIAEFMFFAAIISAYIVNRASSRIIWPPVDQPRLPIEMTGVNTVILIMSAVALTISLFSLNKSGELKTKFSNKWTYLTIFLGSTFIFIQGYEWMQLLGYGMKADKDLFAAFFYTLIGFHGLHATIGLLVFIYLSFKNFIDPTSLVVQNRLKVASVYWYFVVGIWPIIYYTVYIY